MGEIQVNHEVRRHRQRDPGPPPDPIGPPEYYLHAHHGQGGVGPTDSPTLTPAQLGALSSSPNRPVWDQRVAASPIGPWYAGLPGYVQDGIYEDLTTIPPQ